MTKDYRKELIENLDQYRIGLDDVFAFKCRGCGKCCKDREDIMLNSRDVYNIATALGMAPKQVIETYCEIYIGRDSRLPIVRLKPKGINKACPLLVGGRCSVHAANPAMKPTVCALFPIGRVMASEVAPEDMGLGTPNEIQYILSPAPCASAKRRQTVRTWLEMFGLPIEDRFFIKMFGLPIEDRFFIKWNKTAFELMAALQKIEEKPDVTPRTLDMLWGSIYMALYADYDTHKEFYPQFEANVSKILSVFAGLERLG